VTAVNAPLSGPNAVAWTNGWPYCTGCAGDTLGFEHDTKPGEPIGGSNLESGR
jgi:hypothetical protein